MKRYQVRANEKQWGDKGPDLLRKADDAVSRTVALLPTGAGPWFGRKSRSTGGYWPWQHIGARAAVALWLEEKLPTLSNRQTVQIGHEGHPRAVIRAREFEVPDLSQATGRAEVTNALVREAFGNAVEFAGCFACKDVENNSPPRPGIKPSDHAWGDAVDETPKPAQLSNDDLTDWCIRMANTGNLPVEQILGSSSGRVVNSQVMQQWQVREGGADSSHLWHIHMSCRIHTGVPPCAQ